MAERQTKVKIAIVGAGPVGCTLARLLTQSSVSSLLDITIFEAEAALDFRSQGGTLDLHEKTGQLALRRAGLFEEWQKFARYDGEAMKIADKNLLCYVEMKGGTKENSKTGRPEIDRPQLRKLLYESLPNGIVKWQHKLVRIDRDTNSLHFANGRVETGFDLVVGADGAWSKVRPILSDNKPEYSGIGGHEFTIPAERKTTHPELFDLVNRGSLFSWSDGKSLMAQAMSDGSLVCSTYGVKPIDWQKTVTYNIHDPVAVKQACLAEYADWDVRLKTIIEAASTEKANSRDLYMLPVGHRWEHVPGFTLIGDSAHLMTPFAGEGVNLGMKDSLMLSEAIILAVRECSNSVNKNLSTVLSGHIRNFEEDMFVRAKKTLQMTVQMMSSMYLRPGAPRTGIEDYILGAMSDELGWATQLVKPFLYAYFFVWKLIW